MKNIVITIICCAFYNALFAQTAVIDNKPAMNAGLKILPTGPGVFGVFDGRSPCKEMAQQLHVNNRPDCIKIKWRLILYQDSVTHMPTSYTLDGFIYRNALRTGKWIITHGTKANPGATVIKLDPDKPGQSLYLLKADDNVLFFLDSTRTMMVGNQYFSYTLYKTVNYDKNALH